MTPEFESAFSGLIKLNDWFVYHLEWSPDDNKYKKVPARPDGSIYPLDASQTVNRCSYEQARGILNQLDAIKSDRAIRYTLGFWLTADSGFFFLDIDKCITDGKWSNTANYLHGLCPGAAIEYSSSGMGIHIIGRASLPPHANRNKAYGLELYTQERGIAFGLDGRAWGSCETDHSSFLWHVICPTYFPPLQVLHGELLPADGPRADWSGPIDDDALIAKAIQSASAAALFTGKARFADLWNRNEEVLLRTFGPESESEWDAALAAHLAFWTGCDEDRMVRLMQRSALVRPKWKEHRTYLRELTVRNAINRQRDVYNDKRKEKDQVAGFYRADEHTQRGTTAIGTTPTSAVAAVSIASQGSAVAVEQLSANAGGVASDGEYISADAATVVDQLLDLVSSSKDVLDVHNRVIPAIRAAAVIPVLMGRLENAVNKRLDLWDAKMPMAQLRTLLRGKQHTDVETVDAIPMFVSEYVYVSNVDKFLHLPSGDMRTITGFGAKYDRYMPVRDSGVRESAAQWALQRWDMQVVSATMYYPGQPGIFAWNGLTYANEYNERVLPPLSNAYTDVGRRGIEAFTRHLWALTGRREEVYTHVLAFMAHNVQRPGVKIRHCPIIKGVEGDGKSLLGDVMRTAMGKRNVRTVGPTDINNSGGFTGWAHGSALVMVEEIMIAGRDRYRVSNMIKPFITNNFISYTRKGKDPQDAVNTTNYLAVTNYVDAVPISNTDRRWMVIFTPFDSKADMLPALGLTDPAELKQHFDVIFESLEQAPGEWRRWLMEFAIPEAFDRHSSAPVTDEKEVMAMSGIDDAEMVARQIIEEGSYGVSATVLSSGCLSAALKSRALVDNFELPQTTNLSHLLVRIGFQQLPKVLKWDGRTHRIWSRGKLGIATEELRKLLESTKK